MIPTKNMRVSSNGRMTVSKTVHAGSNLATRAYAAVA